MERAQYLLSLADSIVTAAVDFKGQNYQIFIETREHLKQELERYFSKEFKNEI